VKSAIAFILVCAVKCANWFN